MTEAWLPVQVILAVQGVRTLTDPNTLPTIIADAVTLVKDPKAAVQAVPQDLLSAVKTILSIPQTAASDGLNLVETFLKQLDFPGKFMPNPDGETLCTCTNRMVNVL